jgi:hypothetical protein
MVFIPHRMCYHDLVSDCCSIGLSVLLYVVLPYKVLPYGKLCFTMNAKVVLITPLKGKNHPQLKN